MLVYINIGLECAQNLGSQSSMSNVFILLEIIQLWMAQYGNNSKRLSHVFDKVWVMDKPTSRLFYTGISSS